MDTPIKKKYFKPSYPFMIEYSVKKGKLITWSNSRKSIMLEVIDKFKDSDPIKVKLKQHLLEYYEHNGKVLMISMYARNYMRVKSILLEMIEEDTKRDIANILDKIGG